MKVKQAISTRSPWLIGTVVLALLATLSVSAKNCDEWRQVDAFDRLHVTAAVEIEVSQAQHSAVCFSSEQLDPSALTVQSIDGVLYVDGSRVDPNLTIHVASPVIRDIYVNAPARISGDAITASRLVLESHGPSDIRMRNMQVQDLVVQGSGNVSFRMSGAATHQSVDLDGIGAYLAQDLASETSQVSVRGSGRVELWVEEILDVDIFGAASVLYGGSPWVSQNITGHGAIGRF